MANKKTTSIQDWLESLDLGHFTNNFLINGLTDLQHVCNLTEDQLGIMGITQRGYQKRIMNHLPSEAEAFLSKFVSSSEKPNTQAQHLVEEVPPPTPPRRVTPKQQGKENGHPTEKKPTFDDESYLLYGPTSGINPVLPPRRPLSDADKTSSNLGPSSVDSEPIPVPPPRGSGSQGSWMAIASEIPSNQSRMRPTPQPRVRSDPSLPARPPPLMPKHRSTPQVPPRVGPSQMTPAVSSSDHFQSSRTLENIYDDDPCQCVKPPEPEPFKLLSSPPVPTNPVSQFSDETDEDLPNLPPPPPPKSITESTFSAPAARNLPPVPHPNHQNVPELPCLDHQPFQPPNLTDNGSLGLPPLQMSLLSPPPVLSCQSVAPEEIEEDNMPSLPPPPPPVSVPPRPPSLPEPHFSDALPPRLPPKDTSGHLQLDGTNEDTMPVFSPMSTPTTSFPVIPPRPPSLLVSEPLLSELPLPKPTQKETPRYPDSIQSFKTDSVNVSDSPSTPVIPPRPPSSYASGATLSDLPPPLPTHDSILGRTSSPFQSDAETLSSVSSIPVIPPRPPSLSVPDQLTSNLSPPLPKLEGIQGHPDTTQPIKADDVNIFDAAKQTFDLYEFDPFTDADDTACTFSADAPLRPPSIFLTPEDLLGYSASPEVLPSVSEHPDPSLPAPDLSLASRPVPLPPGVKSDGQPSTIASDVIAPTLPVRQEHTNSGNQSQASAEHSEIDEILHLQPRQMLQTGQESQSGMRKPPAPPALPARIPTDSEQTGTSNISTRPATTGADSPMPPGFFHKTSNRSPHDPGMIQLKSTPYEDKEKSLLDTVFIDVPTQSTHSPSLPALEQHDIEDQYSKVTKKPPQLTVDTKNKPSNIPQIPARPPQIPLRQEPQGEASTTPERPSPIGSTAQDDVYSHSSFQEKQVTSWSSLQVPVSPSNLSEDSDRHSYILLSESMSGIHDTSDEKTWPDKHPYLPSVPPLSSSTLDKPSERDSLQMEGESEEPQKPARPAPPPPVSKPRERSPAHLPKLPARPDPAVKEFIPQLPPIQKEDEYDFLDPSKMVHTSLLRDKSLDSHEGIAFKELAQSEESGDDDDSGFDMDSLDYGKAAVKQKPDLDFEVSLADRRSKIDLGHVLRMGKVRPEVSHRPLARTHSRAVDEITRHRLSNKLSQSLQDRNSTAEIPAKVTVLKKKGYLWKQGGKQNNKGFRKRWMDFDGTEMRYYENEKKLSECKGIIPVGTMRDVKNLCGASSRPSFGDTKQYRITLETTGRSFHFAAETLDEGTLWANILMQAILSYKPPPGGFPVGGDMSCPDKKCYVKIEGYFQKRYLAVKGEKLFIYNTEMDFESAVAILEIEMKLASVKELPKNKIQLATPAKIYIMTIENPQEVKEWIEAMKNSIQEGLSDHTVLDKVYHNSSNKYCADCRMKDPDWASINLGICICKNCSGSHRNLGVHLSKVRSLKMDTKVWTPALVQLMLELGNKESNAFWEANLNEDEKAVPDDTLDRRKLYILNKYKERKYCQSQLSTDKAMDRTLFKSASLGNLFECVQLVFSGANVIYKREDGKTAYDVAKACRFPAVAEFLSQNIGTQSSRNDAASKASAHTQKPTSIIRHSTHDSKQEFIQWSGYLYKTGNNKKEFLKRYCTLEHGIFSYFEDQNQPAKNTIEGIEMVLIAVTEPRQGHKYCFEIYTSIGRTYLMSAEMEEERKEWMKALAKIHSLHCMWESLEDFEQSGFLHKKEGAAATNWQRLWFILKGKLLVSYSSTNDDLEEIDLRKLITLSRQDSDSTTATDYNHTLSIVLPGKNIYLRAETKQAADCWYEAINKVASQGGMALEDQPLTADNVPIIVSHCIDFVATHEGPMTEGIYRLSGTSSVIRKIVTSFMEDPRTARLKEEYSVHDVTGALKKFFRELPNPLLTSELYQKWTEVASYQDHSIRLQWYQHLLGELPSVNSHTLKMLIGHLKTVAEHSDFNKMSIRNLAAVFGPTLMASSDSSYVHAEREIAVIADLLTYYNWLYQVSEEDMAKERKKEQNYQEGLTKIRAARASEAFSEQLIIMEVYFGKKELGNSINIKISMDHTASQVIEMALEQQKKQINDSSWGLFEIIAKGELERLFHGYELVLPQVLQWTPDMAPDNYICLKHNELMEKIEPFMEQASLTDTVKYSESKKTFKKYTFELMNKMVTCYREKNASAANTWKVADMKIYVGVEKKRSPPTKWGISFTLNNEEGIKAMCLQEEASYFFWLAGLLKSKGEASLSLSANSVVDPCSLTYSPHALSFKPEQGGSFARASRHIPDLSNLTNKMSFWRKSRAPSTDDS